MPQLTQSDQLILVNDGSSDTTEAIFKGIQSAHPELHLDYHHQPNSGVSAARNLGISNTQGTFVIFLDADDQLNENALASYRSCIHGEGSDDKVYCGGYTWIRENKVTENVPCFDRHRETNFLKFLSKKLSVGNLGSFCIPSRTLKRIRFDENLHVGEDFVLLLLIFANHDVRTVPEQVVTVHRRENSLRSKGNTDQIQEYDVNESVFSNPALPDKFQKYKSDAQFRQMMRLLRFYWRRGDYTNYTTIFLEVAQQRPTVWMSKWSFRKFRLFMQGDR